MEQNLNFYELFFYGYEDDESDAFMQNYDKATCFCVKTEKEIHTLEEAKTLVVFEDKEYETEMQQNLTFWNKTTEKIAVDEYGFNAETKEFE